MGAQKMTSTAQLRLAQQQAQRVAHRHLADERCRGGAATLGVAIAQRDRLHPRPGEHRGLEHRREEGQQVAAVAGGGLGKGGHGLAPTERLGERADGARGRAEAAATDEDGAEALGDGADHRPGADLRLGDEARRVHRVDGVGIEPGDVVGDEQRRLGGRGTVQADVDREPAQQPPRPAPHQAGARRRSQARRQRVSAGPHVEQVSEQAEQAQRPDGKRCVALRRRGGGGRHSGDWRGRHRGG